MPAITQQPRSASARANQTRGGGCSAKEKGAADHRQDRRHIAYERGVGDSRSGQREMKGPYIRGESETGENEGNGEGDGLRQAHSALGNHHRPSKERRNRERHSPGRASQRSDVQKTRQNARPCDDGRPNDDGDPADFVDGLRFRRRWRRHSDF
jgi:hypothetical protein